MNILNQKILRIFLILSGAILLFSLILIYLNIGRLSQPIILHFDNFKGVDAFGDKIDVWGLWLVGLAMILINLALGELFFYKERVLSYLLVGINILFSILLLVIVAVIINVN